MSDQLLVLLRICLLALVYLVFLRVLRAVWVELRAENMALSEAPATTNAAPSRQSRSTGRSSSPAPRPKSSGGLPTRIVMVAPPALAGTVFSLAAETTIGRGAGCGVSIDDTHISKLHARVFLHDGAWFVEDLGSTNGTMLNGKPVDGPTPFVSGSRLQVGEVVLEIS